MTDRKKRAIIWAYVQAKRDLEHAEQLLNKALLPALYPTLKSEVESQWPPLLAIADAKTRMNAALEALPKEFLE